MEVSASISALPKRDTSVDVYTPTFWVMLPPLEVELPLLVEKDVPPLFT